jgi:superoxide oxidase
MRQDHRIHPQLIMLHWLMAAMLILAVGAIVARAQLPAGHAWRPVMRSVHLISGQLILGLVVIRLLVRWQQGLPSAAGVGPWAARAGWAVHALLYGVMLAQPITGILFMQAGGKPVGAFGWHLPVLIAEDSHIHADLKELHQTIGSLFYGLLALHVCAALWHHVVLRNQTLHRMLPWLPARTAPSAMDQAGAMPAAPAVLPAQPLHGLAITRQPHGPENARDHEPPQKKQPAVIDE